MKKIIIAIIALVFCSQFIGNAQNTQGKTDDMKRIALTAYVPPQIEGMPESARANLENKLNQIVTENGLGGEINQRFIITANISVLTKDITPTAPPMHAYTIEVTLYVGDGIAGTLFASTSTSLKGVGETETKAYLNALKNLKVKDPSYQSFLEKGKEKIIAYYNDKCDFILKDAETKSSGGNYEEAINILDAIPQVCKDCYMKGMDVMKGVYQQKIDRDCKAALTQAQGIWSAKQTGESAAVMRVINDVGSLLATINAESSCFKEAQSFYQVVAKRVKEIDEREWKYTLQEQKLEGERIKAMRDIGVAYGKNQPRTVYNVKTWW